GQRVAEARDDVEAAPEPHRAHVAVPDGEPWSRRLRIGDIALRVIHAPALADGGGKAFEEPCGATSDVQDGRGGRGEIASEGFAAQAPQAVFGIRENQVVEPRLVVEKASDFTVHPAHSDTATRRRPASASVSRRFMPAVFPVRLNSARALRRAR